MWSLILLYIGQFDPETLAKLSIILVLNLGSYISIILVAHIVLDSEFDF